jgi:putative transposase
MHTYGSILPGAATLSRLLPEGAREARERRPISRDAKRRLAVLVWHKGHGEKVSLTARHFGMSRSTVYVWLRRHAQGGERGLEDRSKRPLKVRTPTWSREVEQAVLALRTEHSRWGKDKLGPLLRREGIDISLSMVGRILASLKAKGQLPPASLRDPCIVRRPQIRPYATRKPKDYLPLGPGDLVQVDSADVRWPGLDHPYKHFTARDFISRWDVIEVYTRATAVTASAFLEAVLERMPFVIKAIQVDGGSEFKAEFEAACQAKGLFLFVLPPRSPKLNGRVERGQRTHKEEFYEVCDPPDTTSQLRAGLLKQELCYNTYRPHQALGQLTPQEWLLAYSERG